MPSIVEAADSCLASVVVVLVAASAAQLTALGSYHPGFRQSKSRRPLPGAVAEASFD